MQEELRREIEKQQEMAEKLQQEKAQILEKAR